MSNLIYKPEDYIDLIAISDLTFDKITSQITANPKYACFKWDKENEPYDAFWYKDNQIPSFNRVFCRLIERLHTIPSQEACLVAYMIAYAAKLNNIYKEQAKIANCDESPEDRFVFDTAMKKRIYNNFYPSLVRDIAGAAQLKTLLPSLEVTYNSKIDYNAQIDIVLYWPKKAIGFGLQQYRLTNEGQREYEDKQVNRHANLVFENIHKIPVGVDMDKEIINLNNLKLIDYSQVLPVIKERITKILGN